MTKVVTCLYHRHRFPAEIIAEAVWLYFRFTLSFRMVEDLLAYKGIIVSHKTVREWREWAEKFGRQYAALIRRWCRKHGVDYRRRLHRKPPSHDGVWHLDELVVRINDRKCWLWRAVDQDGYILDEIVQNRRNTKAARRLLIRLLKKQGVAPKRMVTDKLRSYRAAKRQDMPHVEHRSHKGLNNRAENSHLPFRKRERTRQGFRSIGGLQQFLSIFSAVRNLFIPSRANRSASQIRTRRHKAMAEWNAVALQFA